jgi:hypothetical protein
MKAFQTWPDIIPLAWIRNAVENQRSGAGSWPPTLVSRLHFTRRNRAGLETIPPVSGPALFYKFPGHWVESLVWESCGPGPATKMGLSVFHLNFEH